MISFTNFKLAIIEFADKQIMPAMPNNSLSGWIFGGMSTLGSVVADKLITQYKEPMKQLGFIDDSMNVDVKQVKLFINTAFEKTPKVSLNIVGVPLSFDKTDGEVLISLLEKYDGQ